MSYDLTRLNELRLLPGARFGAVSDLDMPRLAGFLGDGDRCSCTEEFEFASINPGERLSFVECDDDELEAELSIAEEV